MDRDPRELGGAWAEYQHHSYSLPSEDLAAFVARYRTITWNYQEPYRQLVVPQANVHLCFWHGVVEVHGVWSTHSVKLLEGAGKMFLVEFRPGCFYPFLGSNVAGITDRKIPAHDVFSAPLPLEVGVESVEQFLRANLPVLDAGTQWAGEVVDRIAAEPGITKVSHLADLLGTSVRTLQRMFAKHVGIPPKTVIRRYRLHEVTERMAKHAVINWTELAAELGYADQPHLSRDFTALFGEPPTHYAARYGDERH